MKFISAVVTLVLSTAAIVAQSGSRPSDGGTTRSEMIVVTRESGGYIGIEPSEITKDNHSKYGLGDVRGVAVSRVFENSPAAKAGLKSGDVIVGFGNETVTSVRKLQRLVSETAPDHSVALTVVRGGKEEVLSLTVGEREATDSVGGAYGDAPQSFEFKVPRIEGLPPVGEGNVERRIILRGPERRVIGVGVVPLTKQLSEFFGVTESKGLLISEVRENSPAAKAGLKAGDVIVQADGKAVAENEELVDAVNAKKEGDVVLGIVRGKKRETVTLTPETAKDEGPGKRMEEIIIEGPVGRGADGPIRRMMVRPFGTAPFSAAAPVM